MTPERRAELEAGRAASEKQQAICREKVRAARAEMGPKEIADHDAMVARAKAAATKRHLAGPPAEDDCCGRG